MARSKFYYEKYSMPPLKIQYKAGYDAFNNHRQWIKTVKGGATVITTYNPCYKGSMPFKEWERGYNKAYFEQLAKVKRLERSL
tara:strand:+ start:604 stop:852 length:249 start_codon:yes stop_codon:yes gene_type:complete